jgi:serine/threonine protein kinase
MSQSNAAHSDPLIGARVGDRYTIKGVLGQGGMGVVYDGVHDELQRPVAVKVLNTLWATDQTAVQRFLREARTASSFSHGNIVDVTDLGRLPDGRPYLVMPKVQGTDLATLLLHNGPQPAKRVGELLHGAASALDLIHARGYVHRDIKPENLMYVAREDGTETVMLLDFGIAAAVLSNERRLTSQGQVFGTPHYMAPEAATGALTDARGDVYALATVAFELITGTLPFDAENLMQVLSMKLVTDPPTLAQASGQRFPEQLEAVIACGLARDPAARYSTAGELINAICMATEHAPVSWRSGVLRPAQRSDAHPVTAPRQGGSDPWPGQPSARFSPHAASDSSPRPPAGRASDRSQSAGSGRGSGWVAPAVHREPSQGWQQDPQAGFRDTSWQQREREPTMELGAGLRASERMSQREPRGRSATRWTMLVGLSLVAAGALLVARLSGREWRFSEKTDSHRGVATGANAVSDPRAGVAQAAATARAAAAEALGHAAISGKATAPATAHGATLDDSTATRSAASGNQPASAELSGAALTADLPPSAADLNGDGNAAAVVPAAPVAESPPVLAPVPPVRSLPLPPSAAGSANRPSRPAVHAPPVADTPSPAVPSAPPPDPSSTASPTPDSADSVMVVKEDPTPPPPAAAAPESDSAKVRQLTQAATSALLRGEVGRAIELSRQATDLDPTNAVAWRSLGLAYERASDDRAARAAYQRYLDLVPSGAQSDMVRGRMQTLRGN